MNICRKCGYRIPGWASNYCPDCGDGSISQWRFTNGQIISTPYQPRVERVHPENSQSATVRRPTHPAPSRTYPAPIEQKVQPTNDVSSLQPSPLRQRLESFNQLLADVYGENLRLGHLLIKHGISESQIDIWRKDTVWLEKFLSHAEQNLVVYLESVLLEHKPRILFYWYGFDNQLPQHTDVIARKFTITQLEVNDNYYVLINYLKSPNGQEILEKAVVVAAEHDV